MRNIPAEALALGEAGGGAIRVLIRTTIEGVTYNFIDEPEAAVVLDGVTYQGLADGAVRFSGVPDGGGMEASRFALTIDSAGMLLGDAAETPAEILSHISDHAYQGAEVDVDFAIGTGINGTFVAVIEGISGRFTGAPMAVDTAGGSATRTMECQTLEQDYGRSNGGTRGPAHCRRFFADDTGMDFVPQVATETKLKWGVDGEGATAGGRGGGIGRPGDTFTQLV
jgi:hypothetical protein